MNSTLLNVSGTPFSASAIAGANTRARFKRAPLHSHCGEDGFGDFGRCGLAAEIGAAHFAGFQHGGDGLVNGGGALRLAQEIEAYLQRFKLARQGRLFRTDAYHWIAAWRAPAEPVNVFLSPPFPDLSARPADLLQALRTLQEKVADESVSVLQSERGPPREEAPARADWEHRRYSRNVLLLWQKGEEQGTEESHAKTPNRKEAKEATEEGHV